MAGWENFFIAEVGASAALAGLVLVGVSINLTKIMSFPGLSGRAFESLMILLSLLVVSSLMLVPEQPLTALGIEMTVVAGITWAVIVNLQIKRWKATPAQFKRTTFSTSMLTEGGILPFVAAGLVILSGNIGGLYWVIPGVALSFASVFLNAWVLLVEINR